MIFPSDYRTKFWARSILLDNLCVEWTGCKNKQGYGNVYLPKPYRSAKTTHRVAWMMERGEIAPGLCVLHSCDNRACIRIGHLRLGTHQENMAEMKAKGRAYRGVGPGLGEDHPSSKLTEEKVRVIRSLRRKIPKWKIAVLCGVSDSLIDQIHQGKIWKHVK